MLLHLWEIETSRHCWNYPKKGDEPSLHMLRLTIFIESYWIPQELKTIESRSSLRQVAPYGGISTYNLINRLAPS